MFKFLVILRDLLVYKFQNQFHKIRQGYLSEIFMMVDGTTEYTGTLKVDPTNDLVGVEKLATGSHFAIAGTTLEVALAPLAAGVPVTTGLKWNNHVDANIFAGTGGAGALNQAEQVQQLFNSELQIWIGTEQLHFPASTSVYEDDGNLNGDVGNFGAFVPELNRPILNGDADSDYPVKIILPTGAETDLLVTATHVVLVRPRFVGQELKGICGSTSQLSELYKIPTGCNGVVAGICADGTVASDVNSNVQMGNNPNKDLGYVYWSLPK